MKQHKFERRENKKQSSWKEGNSAEFRNGIRSSSKGGNSQRFENRGDVFAKKALGQHFLIDLSVADAISEILPDKLDAVVEIGPGMGVLTKRLLPRFGNRLHCIELDKESVSYLSHQEWSKQLDVTGGDFLTFSWREWIGNSNSQAKQKLDQEESIELAVIGNYPYNISTQIVFKVLECGLPVSCMAGMFQKEVAVRLCAGSGNKDYGITSVLLQAYYDCTYLFDVADSCFNPPPKVTSGVMVAVRKTEVPKVNYDSLKKVVKMAFGQRRKTLGNALKPLQGEKNNFKLPGEFSGKRAEQLSVDDFLQITNLWDSF